jgi:hypothetical protein
MGIESRYPFGGYRAYEHFRRFYFHRKEVERLKDVFKFLKELFEMLASAFVLYISFSELRERKRKATTPGRLSRPTRKR